MKPTPAGIWETDEVGQEPTFGARHHTVEATAPCKTAWT